MTPRGFGNVAKMRNCQDGTKDFLRLQSCQSFESLIEKGLKSALFLLLFSLTIIFTGQIKKDIAGHWALCYILDLHLYLNYRAFLRVCQAENLQNTKTCYLFNNLVANSFWKKPSDSLFRTFLKIFSASFCQRYSVASVGKEALVQRLLNSSGSTSSNRISSIISRAILPLPWRGRRTVFSGGIPHSSPRYYFTLEFCCIILNHISSPYSYLTI